MNEVQVYDGKGPEETRTTGAIISDCGAYRYVLTRRISQVVRWVKPALFVMLNPSTADAVDNDPTIRRCLGFANDWLCTSLTVVNVFGLRSTEPKNLYTHPDPRGPLNQKHVDEQITLHAKTGVIICAWGAEPFVRQQPWYEEFANKLIIHGAQCLGRTKDGSPRHPLYLKKDTEPKVWTP